MAFHTRNTETEFWKRVAIKSPTECWEWLGSIGKNKYGYFSFKCKRTYAHRLSYEFSYGTIQDSLHVLHRCDNPRCVNPNHLFLGTQQDNNDDRDSKHRQQHGSQNGMVKLTDAQIIEIRARYATGTVTQQSLADEYGVHNAAISMIINRKRWKYL